MARAVKELAELLARLPGIGRRTATRLAFHLLKSSDDYARALGERIATLHERVCRCEICANISDSSPCDVCADPARSRRVICVVESVPDLWAIESAGTYRGVFHVLHGLLKPLDGIGPDDLTLDLLCRRVEQGEIDEIIVATRPSVEGEATALYLRQIVSGRQVIVSRIAFGIPHGGELEYTDSRTLERAIVDRREMR